MRPAQADSLRIWWLDGTALEQLVGGRGHAIDLLDLLAVPPYLSEELRRLKRRLRGSVAVPLAIGPVRLPKISVEGAVADAIGACRGVLVRAADLSALAELPGFVTSVDGEIVVPPPANRQSTLFRRMDVAIRHGCVCGRKIDLVTNPPHLVEAVRAHDFDAIAVRCEGCASELLFAG